MESAEKEDINANWDKYAWESMLLDISEKKCIPFIGPGASEKWIQLDNVVREWATDPDFRYPYTLQDSSQLPRVSTFLEITKGKKVPRSRLSTYLKSKSLENFPAFEFENSVYKILADLHLPIYVTTNYDHLMELVLIAKGKEPTSDFCRWNDELSRFPKLSSEPPSYSRPLVFHLLGDIDYYPSMVLTEKDYVDFAIYLNQNGDKDAMPYSLRQNLAQSTLLFIGYRLEDMSFLIVFEALNKLMSLLESAAVQVQLPTGVMQEQQKAIHDYLNRFRDGLNIRPFWGSTEDFLKQLRNRGLKVMNK
jgi:hypothetical protein